MDGDVSWNTARLINHSCSNNCDYNGTGLKLWVVATKDIKKDEETNLLTMVLDMMRTINNSPCKCKFQKLLWIYCKI